MIATLVRLLQDFDLAEEAMHEALALAVTQGAEMVFPTIRELGWFPRGDSKQLTFCVVAGDLMNGRRKSRAALEKWISPTPYGRITTLKTTGCGSSLLVDIRPSIRRCG